MWYSKKENNYPIIVDIKSENSNIEFYFFETVIMVFIHFMCSCPISDRRILVELDS